MVAFNVTHNKTVRSVLCTLYVYILLERMALAIYSVVKVLFLVFYKTKSSWTRFNFIHIFSVSLPFIQSTDGECEQSTEWREIDDTIESKLSPTFYSVCCGKTLRWDGDSRLSEKTKKTTMATANVSTRETSSRKWKTPSAIKISIKFVSNFVNANKKNVS